MKWVKQRAAGERITSNLTPHWEGMSCVVNKGESKVQWEITGSFTRKTKHRITIDSLPVGYTLKQYQAVLERLVDDKVIKDYDDLSDNDVFEFEIQVDRSFGERTDEWIMTKLKLIKKVSENFTCIDENNKIVIFSSLKELLEAWYVKRIEYNDKRKQHLLASMQEEMDYTNARAKFIQGVVDGAIELRNAKESAVITQAEAYDAILQGRVKGFLGLPMRSLTTEEIAKLKAKAKALKAEIVAYSKHTFEDILLGDLNTISF
jgi:DNA gyrase/topoisomerase IV subunit A